MHTNSFKQNNRKHLLILLKIFYVFLFIELIENMNSLWLYLYLHDIKLVYWTTMVWNIFKFSSLLSIALIIGLSLFYILCYIDILTRFPFRYFSFLITIVSGIPLSNTTNWLVAPTIGGIIINIILLFYLVSCFLILRCAKALVCYNLIIWKGVLKMDTYNI